MAKKHLAIIGHGMAGSRLLDNLLSRQATSRYRITVFGEEPAAAYNRILLSKVLAGADPDGIRLKPADWRAGEDVTLISGTRVDRISTSDRLLHTSDGKSHAYDLAILATGSRPIIPKISGTTLPDGKFKPGIFAYRTLDDVQQMRSKARPGDSAVILGGGLLGLEAAKALSDCGLHCTVIHLAPVLMNTQLDETGGQMLQKQIERNGIFVRCGRTVSEILGDAQVRGIKLDDGTILSADMVVMACGIQPRVDIARNSGIPTNRAVLVNDSLATQVPGIYSVGECAEHRGCVYGIVTPIWEQCQTLADVLCGTRPSARYTGSKLYTRLKVAGVEVASMGVIHPELSTDTTIQVIEPHRMSYRKLVMREGKLIGAQLVGDTAAAGQLVQYFDRGDALPANPLEALCSYGASGAAGAAASRQICNCNTVSQATIINVIEQGAQTVDDVGAACRAGTGCGSCKGQISLLLQKHAKVAVAG